MNMNDLDEKGRPAL